MWYNGQTLQHKKTKAIVRLAVKGDSNWAWELGEKTAFIDENGNPFFDDHNNYTHIEDAFGRPIGGTFNKKLPDLSLRKYIGLSKNQRAKLKKEGLLAWEARVLKAMDEKQEIGSPFADGSMCWEVANFFLKRRKAKSIYTYYCSIYKKRVGSREKIFEYKGKTWLFNANLHDLKIISLNI